MPTRDSAQRTPLPINRPPYGTLTAIDLQYRRHRGSSARRHAGDSQSSAAQRFSNPPLGVSGSPGPMVTASGLISPRRRGDAACHRLARRFDAVVGRYQNGYAVPMTHRTMPALLSSRHRRGDWRRSSPCAAIGDIARLPFDPDIRRASTIRRGCTSIPSTSSRARACVRAHVAARRPYRSGGRARSAYQRNGNDLIVAARADTLRGFHNVACTAPARSRTDAANGRRFNAATTAGPTRSKASCCVPEMEDVSFSCARKCACGRWPSIRGPARVREFDGWHRRSPRCFSSRFLAASRRSGASRCATMRKEYELACNWKVYVDNYLEGYHIPVVHPTLNKEIDYDSYRRSRSATAPSTPRSPVEASPR